MRSRADQLDLRGALAPIYLLTGEEPLQLMEAAQAIRHTARERGHTEREVYTVETGFDWGRLAAAAGSLSLFAERRLIELRIPTGKPGQTGSAALISWAARPPEETLLLVHTPKLEKAEQASKWFQALEKAGMVVQSWPVEVRALPQWVERRLGRHRLTASREAIALLAERAEGNLLAAAQEVEKLALLHGEGAALDLDAVRAAVADSARYNVFDLVDAALLGDASRAARMLAGLKAEGGEPVMILGALVREVRNLAGVAAAMAEGAPLERALEAQGIWAKRRPLLGAALKRHGVGRWRALLRKAHAADRVMKGAAPGNPWDELVQLAVLIAGARLV